MKYKLISIFQTNTKGSFHNLAKDVTLPIGTASLLGLGSKFCLESRLPPSNHKHTFIYLTRSIRIQALINNIFQDTTDEFIYSKNNLYIQNQNFTPPIANIRIENAHDLFRFKLTTLLNEVQPKPNYNLTKLQRHIIKELKNNKHIVIMDADKNLGITVMKRRDYITSILTEHLLQDEIYSQLSASEAELKMKEVESIVKETITKYNHELTLTDKKFFFRSFQIKHRIPTFYGMPKLHKKKIGKYYKTRPVVAKIGSFIEIASKFCDYYLSKLIPYVKSYLKDSFHLLRDLNNIHRVPSSAKLITADAISMYTNIDTNHGLQILTEFITLHSQTDENFPKKTIIELLTLVMKNNIFTFGDLYFLQKCGTAMGTIVAVKYATLYFASHENNTILPKYKDQLLYYKRFIDDIFIIWLPGEHTWQNLQQDLSFGRMNWSVDKPSNKTNFLDLTITINNKSHLTHKTYEKPLNLHNYLSKHSAHPPGTFKSLIVGFFRRYWLMNSEEKDFVNQITKFAERLCKRGYSKNEINKAFTDISFKLQNQMKFRKVYVRSNKEIKNKNKNTLFFKRTYHPKSVKNHSLQRIYTETLGKINLFDNMIVCNKRPKNIRDILMPSFLQLINGENPSDLLLDIREGT